MVRRLIAIQHHRLAAIAAFHVLLLGAAVALLVKLSSGVPPMFETEAQMRLRTVGKVKMLQEALEEQPLAGHVGIAPVRRKQGPAYHEGTDGAGKRRQPSHGSLPSDALGREHSDFSINTQHRAHERGTLP